MSQERRFTAWISPAERKALEAEAAREGTSLNFVMRMAIREYVGKDALRQAHEDVTQVTGNK